MIASDKALLIGGGIAFAALVLYIIAAGGFRNAGRGAGKAAVGAADGAAAGVVVGAGSIMGIPDTDMDKCRAAMAAGDTFDASLYCPAPVFLKYITTGATS